jgi:pilus assembly protein Flp/PilA
MATLKERLRNNQGQGLVEYGLILVLIAVVVIILLIILGNQVRNDFSNISAGLGS